MAECIAPKKTVTFTVKKAPTREDQRKTIERLMRMEPDTQRRLAKLATQRRRKDNVFGTRAGRPWVNRVKVTKLKRAEAGETFTLTITPQIIPDLKSVESFLDAKTAE